QISPWRSRPAIVDRGRSSAPEAPAHSQRAASSAKRERPRAGRGNGKRRLRPRASTKHAARISGASASSAGASSSSTESPSAEINSPHTRSCGKLPRSKIATRIPLRAATAAAVLPAGPAPITAKSTFMALPNHQPQAVGPEPHGAVAGESGVSGQTRQFRPGIRLADAAGAIVAGDPAEARAQGLEGKIRHPSALEIVDQDRASSHARQLEQQAARHRIAGLVVKMVEEKIAGDQIEAGVAEGQMERIAGQACRRARACADPEVAGLAIARDGPRGCAEVPQFAHQVFRHFSGAGAHIEQGEVRRRPQLAVAADVLALPKPQERAPRAQAAKMAVDPPKLVEAAGDLRRRAFILIEQLMPGAKPHHYQAGSADSTSAEFLDPKAMQLQSACRISARRPRCGT